MPPSPSSRWGGGTGSAALRLLVVALGVAVIANALSPRGLSLHGAMGLAGNGATITAPEIEALTEGHGTEAIVLVDARDPRHYAAGHLPGALLCDASAPTEYLAAVLARCGRAQLVVVYCSGGSCRASELVADLLRDAAMPGAGRYVVYPGGIEDWNQRGLPLTRGNG